MVTAAAPRKPAGAQEPCPVDLTAQKIRSQIPKHYFERSTLKSVAYLTRDLIQVATTVAVMWYAVLPAADVASQLAGGHWASTAAIYAVAWNLYAYVQGLNFTGVWVLAHECGHRAFSPSEFINDCFGMVLHSALLVPYHSWRISHGNHHKHTNHLEQDTVFVPEKRQSHSDDAAAGKAAVKEAVAESPIVSLFFIIVMLTVGWPGYLLFNMTGQKYERRANHFEPMSPLFRVSERFSIVKSDIGLAVVLGVLGYAAFEFGAVNVALWYGAPYLWVNAWLVFITYLQHTDVRIPHYSPEKWNFVRGALSTIDRDFGPVLNWWMHHIQDSHVVHHCFSQMPFYNAIEVTRKHIKPILGEYYVSDNRSLAASVWDSWRNCRYIVPSEGVAYFRKGKW